GTADLVGLGEAGLWCLFASAIDGGVRKTVIDADDFDNTDDAAWEERCHIPCIRSIGDVATAAALIAPNRLTVFNMGRRFDGRSIAAVFERVAPEALAMADQDVGPDELVRGLCG
ncbi:MAG: hypothetical protein JXR94_10570, partial [Candidatus Hydrogenedentes bacterium]|nr:hypothetical protein [Candidatus Hydrogenedentota bacterium]